MSPVLAQVVSRLRSGWRQLRGLQRPAPVIETAAAQPPLALPSPLVACASAIIPSLDEAESIADVVRHALVDPATAEVIVVDDSSIDQT